MKLQSLRCKGFSQGVIAKKSIYFSVMVMSLHFYSHPASSPAPGSFHLQWPSVPCLTCCLGGLPWLPSTEQTTSFAVLGQVVVVKTPCLNSKHTNSPSLSTTEPKTSPNAATQMPPCPAWEIQAAVAAKFVWLIVK